MKTLYVSDLDGTLLTSDIITSSFTNDTLNELTQKGLLFSYATARSYHTSKHMTAKIQAKIPVIVYNGALILDNITQEVLVAHYFDQEIYQVLDDLLAHQIYPIVYSRMNGMEKMSYVERLNTPGVSDYIASRKGDDRLHPIDDIQNLYEGDLFYLTCIDDIEKLMPLFEKYRNRYHCVCYKDIYSEYQWLEIMPKEASKAHAVMELKQLLHCDRLVVFGDGMNDYEMFEVADECYATSNAVDALKEIANRVIGSNNEDAVAKWILDDFIKHQEV